MSVLIPIVSLMAVLQALPPGVTRGPSAMGITEYRLANGLKVLLKPDYSLAGITVTMRYHVGTYGERQGERGIAHLLEHLAFTGTARHPRLRREITAHGADVGASTGPEHTVFGMTVPPTMRALRWALDVESDRMSRLSLDPNQFEAQRSIVLNEVGVGRASLEARVRTAAFDVHPYGNHGQNADVRRLTTAAVRAFYARHYGADNAVLSIDGAFDEPAALEAVARAFAKAPRRSGQHHSAVPEPPQEGERIVVVHSREPPRVIAAYHVPSIAHADFPAVQLMLRTITAPDGRVRAAVERTKVAGVSWSTSISRDPNLAIITVSGGVDSLVERTREAVREALDGLDDRPLTDAEIDVARPRGASDERSAEDAAACEIAGDWRLCLMENQRLSSVPADSVRGVARRYFIASNRTVGVLIPTAIPATARVANGDAGAVVRGLVDTTTRRLGERFEPTADRIASRLTRTSLPSGLVVALLPKATRGETVSGVLTLDVGDEESLRGRVGAGELLARMLMSGTRTRSGATLDALLAKLDARVTITSRPRPTRVSVDPFVDLAERSAPFRGVGLDVRFRTTRPHLPAVLELIADLLQAPALDVAEFERVKQRQLQLVNERASLTNVDFTFDGLVPSLPAGHPERVPAIDERRADLARISIDDVRRFHAEFYGASSGALAIVGDLDKDSVVAQAARLFGTWRPAIAPRAPVLTAEHKRAVDTVLAPTAGSRRGTIVMGTVLPLAPTDNDYAAVVIANHIFGGSLNSRLFSRVRERDGLSYSVGSRLRPRPGSRATQWIVEASYDLENADRTRAALRDELARALRDGFSADEVDVAITGYLARSLVRRADDAALAELLTLWTPSALAEFESRVSALTPGAVTAAFRRYVRPDLLTVARIR